LTLFLRDLKHMDANSKANEQEKGEASIESHQHHHAEMDRNDQLSSWLANGIIISLSGLAGIREQPKAAREEPSASSVARRKHHYTFVSGRLAGRRFNFRDLAIATAFRCGVRFIDEKNIALHQVAKLGPEPAAPPQ
jgi:hypothetical protein